MCKFSPFSCFSFHFILCIFRTPSKFDIFFLDNCLLNLTSFLSYSFFHFQRAFHSYSNIYIFLALFFSHLFSHKNTDHISFYFLHMQNDIKKGYHICFDYNHIHVCVGPMNKLQKGGLCADSPNNQQRQHLKTLKSERIKCFEFNRHHWTVITVHRTSNLWDFLNVCFVVTAVEL